MANFVKDIENLTEAILGDDPGVNIEGEGLDGGRVDCMGKLYNGKLFIFAANLGQANEKAKFTVDGLTSGEKIMVYGEPRHIISSDGYFEDQFAPIAVHIYIIGDNSPLPPARLKIIGSSEK